MTKRTYRFERALLRLEATDLVETSALLGDGVLGQAEDLLWGVGPLGSWLGRV